MTSRTARLQSLAQEEVEQILRALPAELRKSAAIVPIVYDGRSNRALTREDLGDTLGLFVGGNLLEEGQGGLPPQIILYLENLWLEAEQDEVVYRREVRATLLHELGHYLGLEEFELEDRGL